MVHFIKSVTAQVNLPSTSGFEQDKFIYSYFTFVFPELTFRFGSATDEISSMKFAT